MQVPAEIKAKWNRLNSRGDVDLIHATVTPSVTKHTIRNALKKGVCADKIFVAVAEFYNEKEKKLAPLLTTEVTNQPLDNATGN